jgi:hypothetical protein
MQDYLSGLDSGQLGAILRRALQTGEWKLMVAGGVLRVCWESSRAPCRRLFSLVGCFEP